ncbi:MAG: S9 family peptidase [bacterium]
MTFNRERPVITFLSTLVVLLAALSASAGAQAKRPMRFSDQQMLRTAGQAAISPNGKWMLYSVSALDWKAAKSFRHIFIAATDRGAASARQLTFSANKSESSPRWSADGSYFVFESDREADDAHKGVQLYAMRLGDGEARRITDTKDGVASWTLSRDGTQLVYASGADGNQLYAVSAAELLTGTPRPVQITHHGTGVLTWKLSRDGSRIFFTAPDSAGPDDAVRRMLKKLDVQLRNSPTPLERLWVLDMPSRGERLLTAASLSVSDVVVSPDGAHVGFRGTPNDRYARTTTEGNEAADLYLLTVATGGVERLTHYAPNEESPLSFSPDGKWMAFTAANDFVYGAYDKLYLRSVADVGGKWRKIGAHYDGLASIEWWSANSKTIYFTDGVRATRQVLAFDLQADTVRQLTHVAGSISATRADAQAPVVLEYSDPVTPPSLYLAASESVLDDRSQWQRMTDLNPQTKDWALGAVEEITWKSNDGTFVGGLLVRPAAYVAGRKYPLIVQLHGGPASAAELAFRIGYDAQVYAGAGYAVFVPNYRGSTNYGEHFMSQTSHRGQYFVRGYEDIMSGVDHLIAMGLVHPDSLGVMGGSAGGHYSNWILTHTHRFKAIATSAGAADWISMYAQSDVQRGREWYLGGKSPYDDFAGYWDVSPLKYIKSAKTPTLIEFMDGDPRVPRPQGDELYMALTRLGVPTEYLVYPGNYHGYSRAPLASFLSSTAKFNWFEKWIRGRSGWLEEKDLATPGADQAPARGRQ